MDKCSTCNHLLFLPFYLITSIYCFKQNTSVYHAFSNQKIQMYPAGIRHPCETKFDNHLQDLEHSNYTLNIPLIPTTPEEMEDMFRLCSHVRFKIPQQVRPTLIISAVWITLYVYPQLITTTEMFSKAAAFCLLKHIFSSRFFKDW